MNSDNKLPKRKSIRLKNYDYTLNGYYFVTICTHDKEPNIQKYRKTVERILQSLPEKISGLEIDYTSLMPTHLHTIFVFNGIKKSLGEIVRIFKAIVSKETGKRNFWQRNYYEHVIRNEKALLRIREYIRNNPIVEKIRFEQFYEAGSINRTPTKAGKNSPPPFSKSSFMGQKIGLTCYSPTRKVVEVRF